MTGTPTHASFSTSHCHRRGVVTSAAELTGVEAAPKKLGLTCRGCLPATMSSLQEILMKMVPLTFGALLSGGILCSATPSVAVVHITRSAADNAAFASNLQLVQSRRSVTSRSVTPSRPTAIRPFRAGSAASSPSRATESRPPRQGSMELHGLSHAYRFACRATGTCQKLARAPRKVCHGCFRWGCRYCYWVR
jgi:hypothetical protein